MNEAVVVGGLRAKGGFEADFEWKNAKVRLIVVRRNPKFN
jgi:hypothetical protein